MFYNLDKVLLKKLESIPPLDSGGRIISSSDKWGRVMKLNVLMVVIAGLFFCGCASSSVFYSPYGTALSPKKDTAEIDIYNSPPMRNCKELGEFKYIIATSRDQLNQQDIVALKVKAREAGADAVFIKTKQREKTLLLDPGPVTVRGLFLQYDK